MSKVTKPKGLKAFEEWYSHQSKLNIEMFNRSIYGVTKAAWRKYRNENHN